MNISKLLAILIFLKYACDSELNVGSGTYSARASTGTAVLPCPVAWHGMTRIRVVSAMPVLALRHSGTTRHGMANLSNRVVTCLIVPVLMSCWAARLANYSYYWAYGPTHKPAPLVMAYTVFSKEKRTIFSHLASALSHCPRHGP